MEQLTPKQMSEWMGLIARVITPIGVVALLFLNTQYATKDDLQSVQRSQHSINVEMTELKTAVTLLIEQQKQNARQDHAIREIENRLRECELTIAKGGDS